ncbi:MAG: hypothetical protein H7330_04895 [Hymenobacteraceae bacterium]|nr:hypothetical protein [Hymenobacteraceae bacterium]
MENSTVEDALRLVPQDLSRVVESMMHVYQGNHDHLPDLLSHAGTLIVKVGRRLSTGQLLTIGGLLAVGALLVLRQVTDGDDDDSATANGSGHRAPATAGGPRNGEHRAASHDKP